MSPRGLTLLCLGLSVCVGCWRRWDTVSHGFRKGWRDPTIWLQPTSAALLYFLLFPPPTVSQSDALVVLTTDAGVRQVRSLPNSQSVIALPNSSNNAGIEHAPDLATALRRHPESRGLTVLGAGLEPRDLPAAADLAVRFDAAAPHGLVELQSPRIALLGHAWEARGRALAPALRIELHDPSGALADAQSVGSDGRFDLTGIARGAGAVRFELQLFDSKHSLIEKVSVPLIVQGGRPMRVIVRAGAANPELKYWLRWATDAGIEVSLTARLTDKLALRTEAPGADAPGAEVLSADALARADLVCIDARAWAALQPAEKSTLRAAVEQGLGLLLRADGPVDSTTMEDWKAWGYSVSSAKLDTVTLDRRTGLRTLQPFTAAPLRMTSEGSTGMLESDDGASLARWRAQGKGRVGLWLLLDSFKLVLLGEPARYASLWSDTLQRVARSHPTSPSLPMPPDAWVGERAVLCGLGGAAAVLTPTRELQPLVPDDARCAGYWPGGPGWHTLQTSAAEQSFYVRQTDDGSGLRRMRDREATAALAEAAPHETTMAPAGEAGAEHRTPASRWPFFGAWMLVTALLWWCERRTA